MLKQLHFIPFLSFHIASKAQDWREGQGMLTTLVSAFERSGAGSLRERGKGEGLRKGTKFRQHR